jgi:hypothetical protein
MAFTTYGIQPGVAERALLANAGQLEFSLHQLNHIKEWFHRIALWYINQVYMNPHQKMIMSGKNITLLLLLL